MLFIVLALARREGEGGGAGIVRLRRARLGFEPQDLAEKGLRLFGRDGLLAAGRTAAILLPFLDPVPDIEAGGKGADVEFRDWPSAARRSTGLAHGQLARARKVAVSAVSRISG